MITHSDQISNLASALLKAQQDIGAVLKTATNPYFKSKYADLQAVIDAVKEPLNRHGISFLQAVDKVAGDDLPVIDTILLHESGQYLSTRTPVFCAKPNDPQAFGSGITYSKRYALQALLGLPTEDDDGNAATANNGSNKTQVKPQAKPEDNVTKLIEQAFFNYQTEHADEVAEGFACDGAKFKDILRKTFVSLYPTQVKQRAFKWTAESIKDLAEKIKTSEVLVEVKS
jgi:hypothetical protein